MQSLKPCGLKGQRAFAGQQHGRPVSVGRHGSARGVVVRAGLDEDVLARLRAAEEEAARLRKELEAAQKQGGVADPVETGPKPRIDGQDVSLRETIWDAGSPRSTWLSEKDVEFFSGPAGIKEEDPSTQDPEYKATVTKRILIGAVLTAGLGAFALVPTEALRPKPSKPMYFYLVPVLRVESLLSECKAIIEDADWPQLRQALNRIDGPPNNIRTNLDAIIALIPEARSATRATELSADLYEYLRSLDPNEYFDIMARSLTGSQNAQFSAFSLKALAAGQAKLAELLALVPQDQLAIAREQVSAGY
ncbi:hypothetical protein HYH03_002945 [Edaphochlamys debaryana]|uniref:Uncharacterized protein n=1 Tax=Edaphochlamys debaryana TaxID=47281 RepID=A0A835YIS6_9CHLO|nr:hypothetical protein HYH03_002945 [Edaphochlamys debaryana]|eukprot:KAG2499370.1 hypothetical protein HYH03_002945 [Edaphochlamys debaryana]